MKTQAHTLKADRLMLAILAVTFVYALGLALAFNTWAQAIVIGGLTMGTAAILYFVLPGQLVTRLFMGIALMTMTALHVNQAQGMIEMHFGFFAFLALLLYYRDWRPIAAAATATTLHHLAFFYLQTQGTGLYVLSEQSSGWSIICLHAGYLLVETGFLVVMAIDLEQKAAATQELQETISEMVSGGQVDLSRRCQLKRDISHDFNQLIAHLQKLVENLEDNNERLQTASQGLLDTMTRNTDEFERQSSETEQLSTIVAQMTASIELNAKSAEEAAHLTDNAQQAVNNSSQLSQEAQDNMKNLDDRITEASEKTSMLATESQNIGSVLDVIRGIAEQTNLLALNAAIEAARAGEKGRGFAVVADEVRSLASRTQESTEEIHLMIEKLQDGSKQTVDAMQTSRELMQHSLEVVVNSNSALDEAVVAMTEILRTNTQIAQATTEQEAAMTEVGTNIETIKAITNQLEGTDSNANSLVEAVGNIRTSLGHFKA